MSLFVSFTVTPVLVSRFGKVELLRKDTLWGKINLGFEHFLDTVKLGYAKLLRKVLKRKRWLLLGTILLITGAIALVPYGFIGAAFIPATDQGNLVINMELEPAATVYKTNMAARQAEEIIMKQPEVETVFSSIGFVSGSVAGTGSNANLAEITLTLVDKKKRSLSAEEFGAAIQQKLSNAIAGVKFTAAATSITGNVSSAPVQIAVKGDDIQNVRQVAEAYLKIAAAVPGTRFSKLSVKDRKPEVNIQLDREKMSLLGLNASQVGGTLLNAFSGSKDSRYRQAGNEYDILVSLDKADRSSVEDVRKLSFLNAQGQTVLLGQFANISESLGESTLQRKDRMAAITVQSNVAGRPTGTVTNEIKMKAQDLKIPAGVSVVYLGDAKNQGDAFSSLGLALLTAFVLVYLIMVALYENAVYPFVVLFSIPVALIGALLALALTVETLNIFTIIGMIMLLGLVSKNAILIVDFTNQLKKEGYTVTDALVEAGKERLRPILMTTLAMILGMLPIALASGASAEIKNGMAWVIIGGLTSSMGLTIFVVPVTYLVVDNILSKLPGKRKMNKTSISHNEETGRLMADE